VLVAAAAGLGWWEHGLAGGGAWLCVDNPGDRPVVVQVDGAEVVIAPAGHGIISCRPGDRRVRVVRDGKVLANRLQFLDEGAVHYLAVPAPTAKPGLAAALHLQ
jgi:hypothetical protein